MHKNLRFESAARNVGFIGILLLVMAYDVHPFSTSISNENDPNSISIKPANHTLPTLKNKFIVEKSSTEISGHSTPHQEGIKEVTSKGVKKSHDQKAKRSERRKRRKRRMAQLIDCNLLQHIKHGTLSTTTTTTLPVIIESSTCTFHCHQMSPKLHHRAIF